MHRAVEPARSHSYAKTRLSPSNLDRWVRRADHEIGRPETRRSKSTRGSVHPTKMETADTCRKIQLTLYPRTLNVYEYNHPQRECVCVRARIIGHVGLCEAKRERENERVDIHSQGGYPHGRCFDNIAPWDRSPNHDSRHDAAGQMCYLHNTHTHTYSIHTTPHGMNCCMHRDGK